MSLLKWLNIFNPLIDLADRWWLARLQRKASKSEIQEEILDDVGLAQQIERNNIQRSLYNKRKRLRDEWVKKYK